MKKLVLIAFVCTAMAFTASAQTEKGTWLLGGNAGFDSTDGETSWMLSPDLGYFIKDNWAIGGRATIGDDGFGTYWAFTAFVKPYFGKSEMGKFFVEPNVGAVGASEVDTELTYGGRLGYALFLNKSIGLEFGAGYQKTGDLPGTMGLNVGFQIHFKK